MTYTDVETSVHDGNLMELYTFTSPSKTYRYTSAGYDIEYEGNTYLAIPIQRSNMEGATQEDTPSLDISMGIENDLVADFAFGISERSLQMSLIRSHGDPSNSATVWEGDVVSFNIKDRQAKLRIPSRFAAALETPLPSVYYQAQCNHVLYDDRCQIVKALFTTTTTIDVLQSDGINMNVLSVGGNPDQWFKGGEIVRVSDGERRLILSQIGDALIINFPFKTLNLGDTVDIVAGCDRTASTCRDKFSNIVNFGGHPLIPILNIFEAGLD